MKQADCYRFHACGGDFLDGQVNIAGF